MFRTKFTPREILQKNGCIQFFCHYIENDSFRCYKLIQKHKNVDNFKGVIYNSYIPIRCKLTLCSRTLVLTHSAGSSLQTSISLFSTLFSYLLSNFRPLSLENFSNLYYDESYHLFIDNYISEVTEFIFRTVCPTLKFRAPDKWVRVKS